MIDILYIYILYNILYVDIIYIISFLYLIYIDCIYIYIICYIIHWGNSHTTHCNPAGGGLCLYHPLGSMLLFGFEKPNEWNWNPTLTPMHGFPARLLLFEGF